MSTERPKDFEQLLDHIDREAEAEGPQGIAELLAYQVKYGMINQLIERRRELHWTQLQLASRAGIGQAEISKIERGRKSPTLDTYARLWAALGMPEATAAVAPARRRDAFAAVSGRIVAQLAGQGVAEESAIADFAAGRQNRRRR